MKRSTFLTSSGAAILSSALPANALASADPFEPKPGAWRTFEITTKITIAPGGIAQVWVPNAAFLEPSWAQPMMNGGMGGLYGVQYYARLAPSDSPRTMEVKSIAKTNNLAVDPNRKTGATLSADDRKRYLAPTKYIPTDGIVRETAEKITRGASSDLDKAKRIYDWIVANTYRKPATRGCGLGNVEFLLQTGDLGGKCADLNGLAVGLARASGIPARDIYGIRVAPSRFGYKALGANSSDITHSQHCRAEFFLENVGWVPFDPADVRKVILEEPPGHLPANDPKVVDAKETLFGSWEGNYIAFNDAHDVALVQYDGDTIPFFMYPQAELNGALLDSLDPEHFSYSISVKELT